MGLAKCPNCGVTIYGAIDDHICKDDMKSIETIIDKHYDEIFNETLDVIGDDMHELLIEITTLSDGKTIRRSWIDRNERLQENE